MSRRATANNRDWPDECRESALCVTFPAWFDVGAAAPTANPAADAVAAAVRPRDFGGPAPVAARNAAWPGARVKALAVALMVHGALVSGALAWRQTAYSADAVEEIPVEVVVEAQPSAVDPAPAATVGASALQPPPAEAPPERPQAETFAPASSIVAAPVDKEAESEAVRDRAREADRRKQEGFAQRQAEKRAQEKIAAEHARREQARRAAEQQQEKRLRVASIATASHAARDATRDAFDAASYAAIVKRGVAAAVARACPSGGGGRVLVSLVIGASGHVASASLTGPSGNGAFDAAAVAAVRRAGPFPSPAGRSSVSVPVAVTCR